MKAKNCEVSVIDHEAGIVCGCAQCRTILREGKWVVGVTIDDRRYFVGCNPPVTCCDEEKTVIEVFPTEEGAAGLSEKVLEIIERDGTTENLVLYEAALAVSSATH